MAKGLYFFFFFLGTRALENLEWRDEKGFGLFFFFCGLGH